MLLRHSWYLRPHSKYYAMRSITTLSTLAWTMVRSTRYYSADSLIRHVYNSRSGEVVQIYPISGLLKGGCNVLLSSIDYSKNKIELNTGTIRH